MLTFVRCSCWNLFSTRRNTSSQGSWGCREDSWSPGQSPRCSGGCPRLGTLLVSGTRSRSAASEIRPWTLSTRSVRMRSRTSASGCKEGQQGPAHRGCRQPTALEKKRCWNIWLSAHFSSSTASMTFATSGLVVLFQLTVLHLFAVTTNSSFSKAALRCSVSTQSLKL